LGLLAAVSFGISAPLAKRLGADVAPLMLAGLLYAGAAIALALFGRALPREPGSGLDRHDVPALAAITVLGGMIGPVLMLIGLARVSAAAGALFLNLEGPFTVLVAVAAFRERLGWRATTAIVLVTAGAAVLAAGGGDLRGSIGGAGAIAVACLAWAIDNNLTRRLAMRDPVAVVRVKTLGAAAGNLLLAFGHGDGWPAAGPVGAALLVGAVSYGASVLLDAYALRILGAAREAAYFATAPFVGAILGAALFRERLGAPQLGAGALMLAGVALLTSERRSSPEPET
jgi:drug/metabolite transporter (DMT)-like permease